jgi:hypothetical protein
MHVPSFFSELEKIEAKGQLHSPSVLDPFGSEIKKNIVKF